MYIHRLHICFSHEGSSFDVYSLFLLLPLYVGFLFKVRFMESFIVISSIEINLLMNRRFNALL